MAAVERDGLGLARPGGEIDPLVAEPLRLVFELGEYDAGETASTPVCPRPHPLELGRGLVETEERAARDGLAVFE